MLNRTRRASAVLAAAAALGLVTTAGAAAASAPRAGLAGPGGWTDPAGPTSLTTPLTVLPDGDRIALTGTGPTASVAVFAPDGHTVPAVRYAPNPQHTYVIPDSVLACGQYDAAAYDIPALHATVQPNAVIPHYPLHILQIDTTGLDGAPATATMFLTNVDDVNRWSTPIEVANGVGRVAVPAGHYSAEILFDNFDKSTQIDSLRIVTQTDFTVADTGVSTLTADERTATSPVTAKTPRPATTDAESLRFLRTDANKATSGLTIGSFAAVTVSPAPVPQLGSLTYQLAAWGGTGPAGTAQPYRYDAMFPAADHIAANQTYTVDASKLEAVHNTIDTDAGNPRHEGEIMIGAASPETGGVSIGHVLKLPTRLTTYFGAPVGDAQYMRSVFPALPAPGAGRPAAISLQSDGIVYTGPGEQWRTWGHGPLTAQVGQYRDGTWCRACSAGGTVDLGVTPLVDSEPDTTPDFLGPAIGHTTIYRDGTQVFSGDNTAGAELTGQPQTPGSYRLVFDLDVSGFPITQSTTSHTDLTVPYSPKPDPAWNLPATDICQAQGPGGPDAGTGAGTGTGSSTPCSILPVLNLGYHLATDGTNTSRGPVQTLDLEVGHQSYGGVGASGPKARVTGATVSVSFDKGATWTTASVVHTFDGHFLALWPNSGAKGSTPWLKVTAADALGGSITQTVANAYTIG
ncbi:MAG: hypothetical protein HOV87_27690 [Catenulispora sp.]|nr:hypothetical protein [Catenulispora sp.]